MLQCRGRVPGAASRLRVIDRSRVAQNIDGRVHPLLYAIETGKRRDVISKKQFRRVHVLVKLGV